MRKPDDLPMGKGIGLCVLCGQSCRDLQNCAMRLCVALVDVGLKKCEFVAEALCVRKFPFSLLSLREISL